MRIKKASIDDCEEILTLQKIAYQSEASIYNDYSIPPLVETIEKILEDFTHKIFLKVIFDNQIVGSVRAYQEDNTCYIGKLIVHPKYQDQGIGTQLLQTIESCFPEVERYELFTGEKSEKNLHLYKKHGYYIYKTERLNENVNIHYLEKSSYEKKMFEIKDNFDELSSKYDIEITKLIPHYEEMLDAVINSIPFSKNDFFKVCDLGCGTGNLTQKVKEVFPNSLITCVDMTPKMIEMAKKKLHDFKDITFIIKEFSSFSFQEKFDVILSSLSLHHLITDRDKIDVYRKIHKALNKKGIFYNFDNVLGANDFLQGMYIKIWKTFLCKGYNTEGIERIVKQHHYEDKPASLFNHIKWLEEVGFSDLDVMYKYYNFAVYGGYK